MAENRWLQSLAGGLLTALKKESLPDPNTPRRVADQLGQWAAHLSKNAAVHWTTYLFSSEECGFCEEDAVADCISCGDPCCLGHAHVSYRGELLCDECVGNVIEKQRNKSNVELAYEHFNLTSGASLEEVNAIYKMRSRKKHPDQGGDNDGMSCLNQNYELLKEHLQRRAA